MLSNSKFCAFLPMISIKRFFACRKLMSELISKILAALILVFARATSVLDNKPTSNSACAELYLFSIALKLFLKDSKLFSANSTL